MRTPSVRHSSRSALPALARRRRRHTIRDCGRVSARWRRHRGGDGGRRRPRRPHRGDRRSQRRARTTAHRRLGPDRRPRLHRHAQPLGLHDPRGAEVREHDPPGRDDDGAGRVALGGPGEAGRERRPALAIRRRDRRLDDARRLLPAARAPAHGDQHRVVRRRGAGLDLRQGLRPVRRRRPRSSTR